MNKRINRGMVYLEQKDNPRAVVLYRNCFSSLSSMIELHSSRFKGLELSYRETTRAPPRFSASTPSTSTRSIPWLQAAATASSVSGIRTRGIDSATSTVSNLADRTTKPSPTLNFRRREICYFTLWAMTGAWGIRTVRGSR